MKRALIILSIVFIAGLMSPAANDAPAVIDRSSADIALIAGWISGHGDAKVFEDRFGDSDFITKAKDAVFYCDLEQVAVPEHLRRVPYEFVRARMNDVRGGNKADPAVLITRTIEADPEEAAEKRLGGVLSKKPKGVERYYYVEVAIGNLAWHSMKIVVFDNAGSISVRIVRNEVS